MASHRKTATNHYGRYAIQEAYLIDFNLLIGSLLMFSATQTYKHTYVRVYVCMSHFMDFCADL